jgi:hypothetical protein
MGDARRNSWLPVRMVHLPRCCRVWTYPIWSPDGQRILFQGDCRRDGDDVYRLAAPGRPTFSPDCARVAFVEGTHIYVADQAGRWLVVGREVEGDRTWIVTWAP